jgi:uncharacterized protein (DUF433 family)
MGAFISLACVHETCTVHGYVNKAAKVNIDRLPPREVEGQFIRGQASIVDISLGTTVAEVFDYLGGGMTIPEFLADFPGLAATRIQACFAFGETADLRVATRRLRALATGKTRLHSLVEVKHELGLDA